MARFDHARLTGLACDLLTAGGMSADHAGRVATTLVAADMMGHTSHGLRRLLVARLRARADALGVPFP